MFLDEPTIGLDPSAKKVVWARLTNFKKQHGVTVFFNTHYMDEAAALCDRLLIMDNARSLRKAHLQSWSKNTSEKKFLKLTSTKKIGRAHV